MGRDSESLGNIPFALEVSFVKVRYCVIYFGIIPFYKMTKCYF